jgi:hypothetical protein
MADSGKFVQSLVTRLCAAKVCQNYERYPIIKVEMTQKSKAMGYGDDLTKIPPFAFSHLLYESMGKYEKDAENYEVLLLKDIARTVAENAEFVGLKAKLGIA